jgi:hypothetical protein
MINYDDISPNVRKTVKLLNDLGWETVDSGDGSHFEEGMECAVPYPMIAVRGDRLLLDQCDALRAQLESFGVEVTDPDPFGPYPNGVHIEAHYSPICKEAIITIVGLTDDKLHTVCQD